MRRALVLGLTCAAIALTGCGDDGGGDGASDAAVEEGERPDIPGLDGVVELHEPEGDAVPVFSWEPFDGADTYVLSVFDAEGRAYWMWEGSATSIPLGGGEEPADPGAGGPTVDEGFTWMVAALGEGGEPLAVSAREPIGP